MCGIVGQVPFLRKTISKTSLMKMNETLLHRGPDGKGEGTNGRVQMAMRRLSIIDLSGGQQPIKNEHGDISIVCNGEIYNYIELKKRLKKRGHKFNTKSDVETIVHLYEERGDRFVSELRGMFAIALLDNKNGTLILARDRLGEKPLYWSMTTNGLVFASEMKAILKADGIKKEINWGGIDKFFHYYYIPEPETMFSDIHKVKPGALLKINLETLELDEKIYWSAEKIKIDNDENPTKLIKSRFKESCKLNLRSDVPVGVALSGGIDSGAILSFVAPEYKDRMKAFSIGYEGRPASDERNMARDLARKFKVEFIEKEITKEEVVHHFPRLIYDSDDPIADIAAHSIWAVNKLANKSKVKVVLGGLGGDELFWGYTWLSEAIKITIQNINYRNRFNFLQRKKEKRMYFYDLNPGFKMANNFISRLYTDEFKSKFDPEDVYSPMRNNTNWSKLGIAKKGIDLIRDVWLTSNCIDLNDRLSMAASVELRSPFLDYKLIESVLKSRKAVMAYTKPQKYYLKKAMSGILPDEVMRRPKKGFTPPVASWIGGILEKYIHLISNGFLEQEKIIKPKAIVLLINTWRTLPMYWYAIYQIILLEIWGREYYYEESYEEIE